MKVNQSARIQWKCGSAAKESAIQSPIFSDNEIKFDCDIYTVSIKKDKTTSYWKDNRGNSGEIKNVLIIQNQISGIWIEGRYEWETTIFLNPN
jgi:hypothetical protein